MDLNLKNMHQTISKFRDFENEVNQEMQEHPDYVADEMQIDSKYISIVLKRTSSGVLHSMYLEARK